MARHTRESAASLEAPAAYRQRRMAPLRCRTRSGGAVELLVTAEHALQHWSCLGRPAKRLRPDTVLTLPDGSAAIVRGRMDPGRYSVQIDSGLDMAALLARYGELPLPPYIKRPDGPLMLDRERY